MKRLTGVALAIVVLVLAAGTLSLTAPYADFENQVFVDIPKGTGTRHMARLLADAGVIRGGWQFLAVRVLRPRATLKAGEYLFQRPASAWVIFDRIARGDVFFQSIVVPEGQTIFDIADQLAARKIMDRALFLAAAHDPTLIRDLDPRAPTLEGYLFPDTYHFPRHTTAAQLCKLMTEQFRKAWEQVAVLGADIHDTVTLASMVEKEARVSDERRIVASVYLNRLRTGMPLQCDPTAIYAAVMENRYRGTIYRSDLASTNAYNTYTHAGLPPGPIANPGIASLQAALKPASTDYLYFVARADGSGSHQFSNGLADHTRAVQQYRRAVAQAGQAGKEARQADGAPGVPERAPGPAPTAHRGSRSRRATRPPGAH